MNTATTRPTTLSSIIERAEIRFGQILAGFAGKTTLERDLAAAERRYRETLSSADLDLVVAAGNKSRAASGALADADAGYAAEECRIEALNQPETFTALQSAISDRLSEAERLLVATRERLAREMSAYIIRGGDPAFLEAYPSRCEPQATSRALFDLRNVEQLHHSIVVGLNKATHIVAANGGRIPLTIFGIPEIATKVSELLAIANTVVPTE